jgi:hypothetical protein
MHRLDGGGMSAPSVHRVLETALAGSLVLVALLTLGPTGAGGWAWGDPATELHWYAGAVHSAAVATQLLGNLALLVPSSVLVVLRWSSLRRPARLLPAALATGATIELLQWALPLGRVVSPVDALLNAAGAAVAGLLAVALPGVHRAGSGRPQRVWAGV